MAEEYAEKIRREYAEFQENLKHDIRPMIVRGNGYNPEKNQYKSWEHKPYPTWVKTKDGRSLIANTKEEEDEILGRKPEQAKAATVDVANLVHEQKVDTPKRGRPKKQPPAPLPANLE